MFNRNLLPIALTEFQRFDKGETVTQDAPADLDLHSGDRIQWECGQSLSGIAEIASVGESKNVGERNREFVEIQVRKIR